jgi:hypothetical protein
MDACVIMYQYLIFLSQNEVIIGTKDPYTRLDIEGRLR